MYQDFGGIMELLESKTLINLAKSYAGECQARTRYNMLEYGATQQGYKALADLIHDISFNEFNHARMFYSFIQTASPDTIKNIDICTGYPYKEKWNLLENLQFAVEDETDEATKIYPEYEKIARKEGFMDIANLYKNIIQVETCHTKLLTELHQQMKAGKLYSQPQSVKWKCADCGYEVNGKSAPMVCPLCQAKQGFFMLQISDGE